MFIKYRSLIYVFSYAPKILIVKLFPAVKWSTTVLGTYCVLTQCGNTMKNTEAGTFLQFWAGHVVARNKITFPSSLVARYGLVLWPLKNYEKGADSAVKGPFFFALLFLLCSFQKCRYEVWSSCCPPGQQGDPKDERHMLRMMRQGDRRVRKPLGLPR